MTTNARATFPRQVTGTLPATFLIVVTDSALLPHPESGHVSSPDWRDEDPTWEDAEWR